VGSYLARTAAGTPLLAVRGADRRVRVFRNACRHRGTQVAEGSGCTAAFMCRYHGWTYGLDGALRQVPHERGFPDLDKSGRGLVPVEAFESHGLVFVQQEKCKGNGAALALDALPSPLIGDDYRIQDARNLGQNEVAANWKILLEGFIEGYHIRTTHRDTFYPLQYDNLNVIETFGANSRIAYPYRAIERQRGVDAAKRSADGTLTYVYQFFPNVMLATFPNRIFLVVLEPLAVDRTLQLTTVLTNSPEQDERAQAFLARGAALVDRGGLEDREMVESGQRGLAAGANEFLEFGRFEAQIAHFHRQLSAALER
jgi:phenylpropionate dioxygenase-like ring-hydroxylating dioxygenase large terminal subunit